MKDNSNERSGLIIIDCLNDLRSVLLQRQCAKSIHLVVQYNEISRLTHFMSRKVWPLSGK